MSLLLPQLVLRTITRGVELKTIKVLTKEYWFCIQLGTQAYVPRKPDLTVHGTEDWGRSCGGVT